MVAAAGRALRVGTRGSHLALVQTEWVIRRLGSLAPELVWEPVVISTTGDMSARQARGDGLFVMEIREALLHGLVDLAVHSLKDLPTEPVPGLAVAAIPPRADPRDAIIGGRLESLPAAARVGTGSPRRAAQLRHLRPDLEVVPLRGNVPTRVRRARAGELDAVILAAAGLERLGIEPDEVLPLEQVLPAPGQGALAVEVRAGDQEPAALVERLDDPPTRAAVTAERGVLAELGGGCMLPVATFARIDDGVLLLHAAVTSSDGSRQIRLSERGDPERPLDAASALARRLLQVGALDLLDERSPRAPPARPAQTARRAPGTRVRQQPPEPLPGTRVLVLRPEGQADDLARALAAAGAEPVVVPAIRILPPEDPGPVDALRERAGSFDWIAFTSANGVASLLDRWGDAALPPHVAAIGPATRRALEQRGVHVDWLPSRYTTDALADELPGAPARVLVVRARIAGPELEERLSARGFEVERMDAYRTEPTGAPAILEALERGVDAIAFTSASIVRAFVEAAGPDTRGAAAFCIGPATAGACRVAGIQVAGVTAEHTIPGLVGLLATALSRRRTPGGGRAEW